MTWTPRHDIACRRLRNILRSHAVACARTLEQKISDAGPNNQRIDPHILTVARNRLVQQGEIQQTVKVGIPWYFLTDTDSRRLRRRLKDLSKLHDALHRNKLNMRIGQALEIAVYRALQTQSSLNYFGAFPNLHEHDDSTLYTKEEPPRTLSGRRAPGEKIPDFIIHHASAGFAAIEIKNVREWFYPDRIEVRDLLLKSCALDAVPVLVARRIHYSTFSVLNPCGVVLHETFNQRFPTSAQELAARAADKTLLGYHDIRIGNVPDERLVRFVHEHLPQILPAARTHFESFKDLLSEYAAGRLEYPSFAARVKRRLRGEPEDFPDQEPDEYGEDI